MKYLILIICTIFPMLTMGQTNKKYLEPIPMKDGRITFEKQLNAPTLSQQELYNILYKWADERYKPNDKMNARIVYTDQEKGKIVVSAEEYMVFSSSMLSLDRTRVYYQLEIDCATENVGLQMSRIRYWYDEANKGGEKFRAEEMISDKNAVNKARTKLIPISGKFRRKTIDLADELEHSVNDVIAKHLLAKSGISNNTQSDVVSSVPVKKPTEKELQNRIVYLNSDVNEIKTQNNTLSNDEIIAQANRITITSGNDEQFTIGKESWGGFGKLFGKDVAFCLLDTQKTMANMLLIENNRYTISFYIPGKSEAALIIKCKKMSVQSLSGEEANKMNPENSANKQYNMYVGEIEK